MNVNSDVISGSKCKAEAFKDIFLYLINIDTSNAKLRETSN